MNTYRFKRHWWGVLSVVVLLGTVRLVHGDSKTPAASAPAQANAAASSDAGVPSDDVLCDEQNRSNLSEPEKVRCDCIRHRLTFCIDTAGNAISDEHDPRVGPGEMLTIVVVGDPESLKGKVIRLEATTGSSPSTRAFPGAPAIDGGSMSTVAEASAPGQVTTDAGVARPDGAVQEAGTSSSAMAAPVDTFQRLLEIHINDIPAVSTLTVYYRVYSSPAAASADLERPLNFNIGKNGYYFEATFVFPTIFLGDRSINAVPETNGRGTVMHLSESNLGAIENLSLGVNVYPFGYPPTRCKSGKNQDLVAAIVPFVCDPAWLLKPIVFQLGTSITHDAFREYFLGGGYSIVRGITVSAGAAFVRGQFFGPRVFEGQHLAMDAQIPGGAIELKYMIRPYFAVSLSPEILQAALEVLSQSKSVVPVHAP